MRKVICISNEKGGTGKSITSASLAVALARQGERVLLIDADPQGSLTISMGNRQPDKLAITLSTVIANIVADNDFDPMAGIIRHDEGVDLMPANIALANTELALVPVLGRETILRQYIEMVEPHYSRIVIDTSPSLGLMTLNALAASTSVIVPVAPKYLDVKGLELLLKTIAKIKKQINPDLEVCGILLTMVDTRTNFTKEIISMIESAYGGKIRIFEDYIPNSVRAAETGAKGVSIFKHDPRGRVAAAYDSLAKGVLEVA
jgi:chromosome partitioning protein